MRSRLTSIDELSATELDAWADLAEGAAEPNAFFAPEFVLPAARGLRQRDLVVALVEEDGELVAALPVVVGRWRGGIPAVSTWRHSYGFLGVPLVRPDGVARRIAELIDGALRASRRNVVALERLGDGVVSRAVIELSSQTSLRPAVRHDFERALLVRRLNGSYLDGQAPHRRRELARQRRRLAEHLGAEVQTVEAEPDAAAVERFLAVEASGWKGEQGTALASDPGHRSLFTGLCERFAAAGRLQLLEMWAGDRLVAVKCNLRSARGAFAFKIGFDEELARFSPGVQLEVDNVGFFHSGDADFMDSCAAPDNEMINRLWPDRRGLNSLVLVRPGLRGETTRAALRVAGRLRQHKEREKA